MKVKFTFHTGFVGSSTTEVFDVDDDITDDELDAWAWDSAVEHAASYGYELCSDECDDEDCEYDHPGSTSIEGSWEKVPEDTETDYASVD